MQPSVAAISVGDPPRSRLLVQVEGPPGLDFAALYRDFADLFDQGESDEWLEFYHRLGGGASAAEPDVLLAAILQVLHQWRARQLWSDSSGSLDSSFLNWLVHDHACVLVPQPQ